MNCKYLLRFDDDLTVEQLRTELQNLGKQWLTNNPITDPYVEQEVSDNELKHNKILCTVHHV